MWDEENLDLEVGSFRVNVECADGYEGQATARACTSSGPYTLEGCTEIVFCTSSESTTGYVILAETELLAESFDVSVSCDEGYEGTAIAVPCTSNGDEYTLAGCEFVCHEDSECAFTCDTETNRCEMPSSCWADYPDYEPWIRQDSLEWRTWYNGAEATCATLDATICDLSECVVNAEALATAAERVDATCTGADDGTFSSATCTGDDDGSGTACALNADSSACAVDGGNCAYTAAVASSACALNADSSACEVDGGDCAYTAAVAAADAVCLGPIGACYATCRNPDEDTTSVDCEAAFPTRVQQIIGGCIPSDDTTECTLVPPTTDSPGSCTEVIGSTGACTYVNASGIPDSSACPTGCMYENHSPTPVEHCEAWSKEYRQSCPNKCRQDFASKELAVEACLMLGDEGCRSVGMHDPCYATSESIAVDDFEPGNDHASYWFTNGVNAMAGEVNATAMVTECGTFGSILGGFNIAGRGVYFEDV